MSKLITITRKIQLVFNTTNKDERNAWYDQLDKWRKICYRGANIMCTHLYSLNNFKEFVYINEKNKLDLQRGEGFEALSKEDKKLYNAKENKEIYKQINDKFKDLLTTSPQNATYQLLSFHYKSKIPTAILTALNSSIVKTFNAELEEYRTGARSLRVYKQNIPIPIQSANILNVRRSTSQDDEEREYKNLAFTLYKLPFRTYFGIDKSNNEHYLSEALSFWFLPEWIRAYEERLSELILDSKIANFKATLAPPSMENISIVFEYVQLDKDRHEYHITLSSEGKEYKFKMRPGTPKDVDNPGVSAHLAKLVKDKYKKPEKYFISGNYKLCDSSIVMEQEQHDNKEGQRINRTKIFLLATIQLEKDQFELDPEVTAECELDLDVPITVKIGKKNKKIGSKDDFLFRRIGINNAYRETQRALKNIKGGRGRKRKLKPLNRYHDYERNVIKDKLHNYSIQLIRFCLDNKAKYIYLKNQTEKEAIAKDNEFILRNWSFNGLKNFIAYKANMAGIELAEEGSPTEPLEE